MGTGRASRLALESACWFTWSSLEPSFGVRVAAQVTPGAVQNKGDHLGTFGGGRPSRLTVEVEAWPVSTFFGPSFEVPEPPQVIPKDVQSNGNHFGNFGEGRAARRASRKNGDSLSELESHLIFFLETGPLWPPLVPQVTPGAVQVVGCHLGRPVTSRLDDGEACLTTRVKEI